MSHISYSGLNERKIFHIDENKELTKEKLDIFYKKWEDKNSELFKDFHPVIINSQNEIEFNFDEFLNIEEKHCIYDMDDINKLENKATSTFVLQGCNIVNCSCCTLMDESKDFTYNEEMTKFTNQLLLLMGENTQFYWTFTLMVEGGLGAGFSETCQIEVTANPESEMPIINIEWTIDEDEDDDWDSDEDDDR